jgi:predicted short-subunit dehydrogenase-like oxidoreductase (DUF2520 family)
MEAINSVAIIGTGNVASHLGTALFDQGVEITGVFGRNSSEAAALSDKWNSEVLYDLDDAKADLALVCVSDDAISELVSTIPEGISIAYTSGSFPLNSLSGRSSIGVFYPLQTFTKDRPVDIFQVPFLIEADSEIFAQQLFDLAWKISRKVSFADSETRKIYHLAAVWVNNFTNHMSYQAKELLDKKDLDFSLLLPLLKETVSKLEHLAPYDAQTGPARRGDLQTIRKHEELQEGIQKELYSLITKSIIETYKK